VPNASQDAAKRDFGTDSPSSCRVFPHTGTLSY
jgi:hypothetical protein